MKVAITMQKELNKIKEVCGTYRYTDLGTFENKQKAMLFRNNNYKWCSCYTEKENGKIRLWVKLPLL